MQVLEGIGRFEIGLYIKDTTGFEAVALVYPGV